MWFLNSELHTAIKYQKDKSRREHSNVFCCSKEHSYCAKLLSSKVVIRKTEKNILCSYHVTAQLPTLTPSIYPPHPVVVRKVCLLSSRIGTTLPFTALVVLNKQPVVGGAIGSF